MLPWFWNPWSGNIIPPALPSPILPPPPPPQDVWVVQCLRTFFPNVDSVVSSVVTAASIGNPIFLPGPPTCSTITQTGWSQTLCGPFSSQSDAQAWLANNPNCTPAGSPSPLPGPTPEPSPAGSPGSSCDSPLYIVQCVSPATTPTPAPPLQPSPTPTPQPQPQPQPQPGGEGQCQDFCVYVGQFVNQIPQVSGQDIINLLTPQAGGSGVISWIADFVSGLLPQGVQLPDLASLISGLLSGVADAMTTYINNITAAVSGPGATEVETVILRAILGWCERILAAPLERQQEFLARVQNYNIQTGIPSIPEAHLMRLRSDIDQATWECYVKAGNLPTCTAEKQYHALREMLPADRLVIANWRQLINDDELERKLSERGMLDLDDQSLLQSTMEFIPPPADLARFMLRNIGDPVTVERFQLGAEFEQLYQGDIVTWAGSNGISEDVLRAYHEAHWDIPDPTSLAQVYQRYGPGRNGVDLQGNPLEITDDDINRAYRERGIAPFWRPYLRAITYHPLPIRQLRMLYVRAVIDREKAVNMVMDNGYSSTNAEYFVSEIDVEKKDYIKKLPESKAYVKLALGRNELQGILSNRGYDDGSIGDVIADLDSERLIETREFCSKSLEHQFETGSIDDSQVSQALSQLDMDSETITQAIERWRCKAASKGKVVRASELCSWAESGLITPDDYLQRLISFGYGYDDAYRIVLECNMKIDERQARARQRQIDKQAAQARRLAAAEQRQLTEEERQRNAEAKLLARQLRQAASDVARAERQRQSALDRAMRQALSRAKASERAENESERRQRDIARAAHKLAGYLSITDEEASAQTLAAVTSAITALGLAPDVAISAAILAAAGWSKSQWTTIAQAVSESAATLLAFADLASQAPEAETVSAQPASNGSAGNVGERPRPSSVGPEPGPIR